jgi:hypothetical protein
MTSASVSCRPTLMADTRTADGSVRDTTTPTTDPRPWRWLGALIIATCGVVAAVLLYKGRFGQATISIYEVYPGVFTAALAFVGMILIAFRGRVVRSIAAAAGVVLAGQLAGAGMVAAKHWVASQGWNAAYDNLAYLEVAAATMAVVMTIALMACVVELVHGRSFPIPQQGWVIVASVVAGAALIVLGDLLLAPRYSGWSTRVGFALVLTLPCGVSLAGTGWTSRAPALVVCLAVAVTSVVQLTDPLLDFVERPVLPVAVTVAASLLIAGTRLMWSAQRSVSRGSRARDRVA